MSTSTTTSSPAKDNKSGKGGGGGGRGRGKGNNADGSKKIGSGNVEQRVGILEFFVTLLMRLTCAHAQELRDLIEVLRLP